MKEVTPLELKEMINSGEEFQLIDVREPHETDIASIGGENIPMGEVMENVGRITRDKKVVIMCRSGNRSGVVIQALERGHGFTNLYNLKGGILAWSKEVDPTVTQY